MYKISEFILRNNNLNNTLQIYSRKFEIAQIYKPSGTVIVLSILGRNAPQSKLMITRRITFLRLHHPTIVRPAAEVPPKGKHR